MFWFEARTGIPDSMILSLKIFLHCPVFIQGAGLFMVIMGSSILYYTTRKYDRDQSQLPQVIDSLKNFLFKMS